jgi:DNA-binding response OmpR family regulator
VKRVLCIDDDAPILEMLRDLFLDMGFEVATAKDGAEGFALWSKSKFDLVVSDLLVPKIDGIRLAEQIRAKDPKQRILIITAINHSLEKELKAAPIDGYFPKPIPLPKLRARVRELLPET